MKRFAVWHTVRGRLLLLAIGIEIIMLTVLVANSARLLHGAMTTQAKRQAEQIAPILNAALTAPLAQRDYVTVQAILDESRSNNDGLLYLSVTDQDGTVIASSGKAHQQNANSPTTYFHIINDSIPYYDVNTIIKLGGQQLGTLHFGLDLSEIFAARSNLLLQGIGIAAIELALSSIVLLLLGIWLTRHLSLLTKASLEVADGNLTPAPLPEGNDDIGQLGAAFNTMSQTISDRVHELDRQKALLTATIVSTTDLVSYKDLQGVYLGANPAFAEFIGKPIDQIIGANDYDLLTPEQADFFRAQDRLMLDQGDSRSNEEWITYPDGRHALLDTKKSPLRDQHGLIIGLIGISRDITARKEMEDELHVQAIMLEQEVAERQKAQEALSVRAAELEHLNETLEARVQEELRKNREKDSILLQQDKLASIGQLAAGVAHEINNPIGFIMSNLETLKGYIEPITQYLSFTDTLCQRHLSAEELRLRDEVAARLDINFITSDLPPLIAESTEGAERVKRIVLDLKDFARPDDSGFKEADLNGLVRSTVNIVRNEIKYVAQLELHLSELPSIICNPQQINQVITNLLVNAAQAIVGQGVITVCTRQEQEQVILSVSDTGHGIPEDIRKRIFDPFFTTKEVGKGTGLGLTISYDIIRKHGGSLSLESTPGVGTTFTIALPINGPPPEVSK